MRFGLLLGVAYHQRAVLNRSHQTSTSGLCALSPGVRGRRPSLKCGQIPSFVADNASPRAQEEPRQDGSFHPTLRRRSSELVLPYTHHNGLKIGSFAKSNTVRETDEQGSCC